LQAGLAPDGQKRLAPAQVGLRFQGAPGLEVLTHPSHGGHTETGELRNFSGAFALFVKADDSFADRKRDRSHGHNLPQRPAFVKLYYLWKCFKQKTAFFNFFREGKFRMNKANGLVGRIKIGLGIAPVAALTGCVGFVDGGGYGGDVVVPGPDLFLFGGGYDRGRDVHGYSDRGSVSRAAAHSDGGGHGGKR